MMFLAILILAKEYLMPLQLESSRNIVYVESSNVQSARPQLEELDVTLQVCANHSA